MTTVMLQLTDLRGCETFIDPETIISVSTDVQLVADVDDEQLLRDKQAEVDAQHAAQHGTRQRIFQPPPSDLDIGRPKPPAVPKLYYRTSAKVIAVAGNSTVSILVKETVQEVVMRQMEALEYIKQGGAAAIMRDTGLIRYVREEPIDGLVTFPEVPHV